MTQSENLSGNGVSRVWMPNDHEVWKWQPKTMTENEVYALTELAQTGFVPSFHREDLETIVMEYIQPEPITDVAHFRNNCKLFLNVLRVVELRHGDLTVPHIFPVRNSIVVIDWGESRVVCDPRPDKRPEGDSYWMSKTMYELEELYAEQESA